MTTKEELKKKMELAKTINIISKAVENAKQKEIKRIVKRLNKMSHDDIQTLKRIINAQL